MASEFDGLSHSCEDCREYMWQTTVGQLSHWCSLEVDMPIFGCLPIFGRFLNLIF